jgi:hypothetical protein
LQDWNYVDNGKPYIVVTKEDGIVFKVIYNRVSEDGTLLLCSTNPNYEPYSVHINDVIELWKFVNYINPKFEEPTNSGTDDISSVLRSLQKEVSIINNKMDALDSKI